MGRGPASSLAKGALKVVQAVPVSYPAPPPRPRPSAPENHPSARSWGARLRRYLGPARVPDRPTRPAGTRRLARRGRGCLGNRPSSRGSQNRCRFVRRLLNGLPFSGFPASARLPRRSTWGTKRASLDIYRSGLPSSHPGGPRGAAPAGGASDPPMPARLPQRASAGSTGPPRLFYLRWRYRRHRTGPGGGCGLIL